MKKIFLLVICFLSQYVFATSCPSVNQLKKLPVVGWELRDSEDHQLLSKKRMAQFKNVAMQFALAEYPMQNKNQTGIRCFYRDMNGSTLEAYLTKPHLIPVQTKNWYQVSGAMQCAAENHMCQFQKLLPAKQLAKR